MEHVCVYYDEEVGVSWALQDKDGRVLAEITLNKNYGFFLFWHEESVRMEPKPAAIERILMWQKNYHFFVFPGNIIGNFSTLG